MHSFTMSSSTAAAMNAAGITKQDVAMAAKAVQDVSKTKPTKDLNDIQVVH